MPWLKDRSQKGVERWLKDRETELHANTGDIWPYLTGASSQGFDVEKADSDTYRWVNTEDYAVQFNGYLVELLDDREPQLDEALGTELKNGSN